MPRDIKKILGQQKALGGALAPLKGRVLNLVICGVTDPDDGWLFADFLGFCKTMEKQSHQNLFLSCFPLDKHWQILEKFKINNIKFGVYGEQREHLFKYERTQFDQCQPFWTQIAPERMLHEVLFSIGKHRRHCRPGDIMNMFIVCHGTTGGWSLVLGQNYMPVSDLTTLLGKFKTNVHINVFSVACYSGRIAQQLENAAQKNRYVAAPCMEDLSFAMTRCGSGRPRTGRFANAVVESLIKSISHGEFWNSSDKCLIPPQIPWTVSHNDDHIRHRLRNASDKNRVFTAQFLHAGFDPVTMPMKELTTGEDSTETNSDEKEYEELTETVPEPTPDETPAPHPSASPVDWHSATAVAHEALARSLVASGQEITPSAQAVAAAEGHLCDINLGNPADLGIFNGLYVEEPPWRAIMSNLYWRSFRQAAIWTVFLRLLGEGLVSAEALHVPINLLGSTTSTLNASCLLGCFQLFLDQSRGGFFGKIPRQSAEWTTDIEWLATIIVRSAQSWYVVFDRIVQFGILGDLNEDEYLRIRVGCSNIQLHQNHNEGEGTMKPDGSVPTHHNTFGFWLPHGLTVDPATQTTRLDTCFKRALDVENAFRQIEQPPVGVLVLTFTPIIVQDAASQIDDQETDDRGDLAEDMEFLDAFAGW